jgi:Na+/H+ antiporter NhaD/arsenite permease-like protein
MLSTVRNHRVSGTRLVILSLAGALVVLWICAPAIANGEPPHRAEQQAENHAPAQPSHAGESQGHGDPNRTGSDGHEAQVPNVFWIWPFVALLLCIAILPLLHRTHHWWERNSSKLLVASVLALVTLLYYMLRGFGFHAEPGFATVVKVLDHAVIVDYIPFIVLLFSLFTISGGINLCGDIPAHPGANTLLLALGGALASFIGTTGASMLLIRPLLQINSERRRVVHTVIFFIFVVSNCGGLLLPIGDPPLFLGYLRGVPFLWTFSLVREWCVCVGLLLGVYYVLDTLAWKREAKKDIALDETVRVPLQLRGKVNFVLLLGVVLAVGLLVPGKEVPVLGWVVPAELPLIGRLVSLREIVMLALAGASWVITPQAIRQDNKFDFFAIIEVACLFIGIFITMQVPIEILNAKGASLGIDSPMRFFWSTGLLSSFLDNAPTYVVFFETAKTLVHQAGPGVLELPSGGFISTKHLMAISCGAVFMGANTYIGNGPNFMVKAIAEQSGIKMPSFFGYMLYSGVILLPILILIAIIFMR